MSSKEEYREAAEEFDRQDKEAIYHEHIAILYQAGDWLRHCLSKSFAIDADDSKEFYNAIKAWDKAASSIPSIAHKHPNQHEK